MSLAELQRHFWRSIRARGGPPSGLAATFTDGARQSAAERVGIYHAAYWQRQLTVLASTFPRLRRSLGEQRFERLAFRYIDHRPAQHPCIERLGEGLPDYLADGKELSMWEVGLARLEWANVACLLAPDPSGRVELPLDLGAKLAGCRLELIPALLVVRVPSAAVEAFDEHLAFESHLAEPRVVFSRASSTVRYAALSDDEAVALASAREGSSVARICEAFSGHQEGAAERALTVLAGWFRKRWVVRVHLEDE
jgi:hypothetical protein